MKYAEIIKLLDAGYSREEILKMEKEPETETKPEEKEPETETKPEKTSEEFTNLVNEMKNAFSEMRKEFTAFNIMNSQQKPEESKTSEDIIANIINPIQKERGK